MIQPEETSVRFVRRLSAPPERVWQAWTEPVWVRRWFGSDPHGTVTQARLNVHPGGSFEVTFRDSDQTEHTCSGVYVDVQPGIRLAFSWRWKSEPGVESDVTVLLAPDGHGTLMHFEHARLGGGSAHDYARGWESTFAKLERSLAGGNSQG